MRITNEKLRKEAFDYFKNNTFIKQLNLNENELLEKFDKIIKTGFENKKQTYKLFINFLDKIKKIDNNISYKKFNNLLTIRLHIYPDYAITGLMEIINRWSNIVVNKDYIIKNIKKDDFFILLAEIKEDIENLDQEDAINDYYNIFFYYNIIKYYLKFKYLYITFNPYILLLSEKDFERSYNNFKEELEEQKQLLINAQNDYIGLVFQGNVYGKNFEIECYSWIYINKGVFALDRLVRHIKKNKKRNKCGLINYSISPYINYLKFTFFKEKYNVKLIKKYYSFNQLSENLIICYNKKHIKNFYDNITL